MNYAKKRISQKTEDLQRKKLYFFDLCMKNMVVATGLEPVTTAM